MYVHELANHRSLAPLKHTPGGVPHIVIEANYTCNLRCGKCYNRDHKGVKPLEQVKAEIDLARTRRTLETVSILGGEPTLYPDLPEVVRHVKRSGLFCQVLTNGVRFREDTSGSLLRTLQEAGVDRIILHADCGQGRSPEETGSLIETLFRQWESAKILHSLSITLYPENAGTLPALMRRYAADRYFNGILVTLARDPEATVRPAAPGEADLSLSREHARIASDLKVEASAYVPSSLDDAYVSWLMYFYYLNASTGETFGLSPRLNRLFRAVYRLAKGKNLFGAPLSPDSLPASCLLSLALELCLTPRRLGSARALLRSSDRLRALRFQYILMQDGPRYNEEHGKVQICYMCPDATVRNGKITPVCLADRINPLPGSAQPPDRDLARTVYGHLQEV